MNHPFRLVPWLCLVLLPVLAGCSDTATLPGGVCNPVSHRKAVVRFAVVLDDTRLPLGTPVALQGRAIGAVAEIAPAGNGTRSDVTVCLRQDALPGLAAVTVFYVDATAPLPVLACAPVEGAGPGAPGGQDLVFAGFASQEEYLAWRAGRAVQQGLGQLLQGFEQIIQGLPIPSPDPVPDGPKPPAK